MYTEVNYLKIMKLSVRLGDKILSPGMLVYKLGEIKKTSFEMKGNCYLEYIGKIKNPNNYTLLFAPYPRNDRIKKNDTYYAFQYIDRNTIFIDETEDCRYIKIKNLDIYDKNDIDNKSTNTQVMIEELIKYGYERLEYELNGQKTCYWKEQIVNGWLHEWRFQVHNDKFTQLYINATRIKVEKEEELQKCMDSKKEELIEVGKEVSLSKAHKDHRFCFEDLSDQKMIKYLNEIRKLEESQ